MSKNFNVSNPGELPPDVLVENFVARLSVFKKIMEEIRSSDMLGAIQHYLIVGQRGMGKTTLLYRLRYEIERDPKLNKWLIPVTFTEEQYEIYDLGSLWESVALFLKQEYPDDFTELYEAMEERVDDKNFSELGFKMLIDKLKEKKKKLVLLIDNFGMLLKNIGEIEVNRLREILMTNKHLRVVAASTQVLEQTIRYDKPFFEFFEELRLEGLDKEETINIIRQLAIRANQQEKIENIIQNEPHRIEAIRRLTGGVIRTIVILFEILADSKDGKVLSDLEGVLDRVTDMYKNRIEILKPQQRKILDAVARIWDGATVKEIMKEGRLIRMGLPANLVSSQLKQMVESQLIEMESVDGKNNIYRVRERFFNIWYLMRSTRQRDKQRVKWLIRFFEIWCSKDELIDLVKCQVDAFKKGSYPLQAAYLRSSALVQVAGLGDEEKDLLIDATSEYLKSGNPFLAKQFEQQFRKSKTKKDDVSEDEVLFREADEAYEQKDFEGAKKILEKLSLKGYGGATGNLAFLYHYIFNNINKAENYYQLAIKQGFLDAEYGLANLYSYWLGNYTDAERLYLSASNRGNKGASNNLAQLYEMKLADFKKAEEFYLKAIQQNPQDAIHNSVLHNLAVFYQTQIKDDKKAEKYYLKAAKLGFPPAMHNLASLYREEFKDFKKAEKFYLKALSCKEFNQNELGSAENFNAPHLLNPKLYNKAPTAYGLGILYSNELQDDKKAEKYFMMAEQLGSGAAAFAMGIRYTIVYNYEKAEKCYLRAIELGETVAAYHLCIMYFSVISRPINEIIEIAKEYLYSQKLKESDFDNVRLLLTLLLSKKQYHFVYNYFNDVEEQHHFKDRFKPLYYATLYFLKDEYPTEYKKAGPELKETIEQIVKQVEDLRKELDSAEKKKSTEKGKKKTRAKDKQRRV